MLLKEPFPPHRALELLSLLFLQSYSFLCTFFLTSLLTRRPIPFAHHLQIYTVKRPARIPIPVIRNPPPTIIQAAAADFRIKEPPTPMVTIPPAIAAMPVIPIEKITAATVRITAHSTAKTHARSARLPGDAHRTRNTRRMN